jgi:phage antirepressor YoqD-like protein
MDAMSQGVDPFTGDYVADGIIADKKAQRCFEYISQVLDNVIKMGGFEAIHKLRHNQTYITREQFSRIRFSQEAIGISDLAERINEVMDLSVSDKVSGMKLANILCEMGYLSYVEGTRRKCINEKSSELGITEVEGSRFDTKLGCDVTYKKLLYPIEAQQFIATALIKE